LVRSLTTIACSFDSHLNVDRISHLPHFQILRITRGSRPNALFFADDPGQRSPEPFSWRAMWLHVRGRSKTHCSLRTKPTIAPNASDADGNTEERNGTVSVHTRVRSRRTIPRTEATFRICSMRAIDQRLRTKPQDGRKDRTAIDGVHSKHRHAKTTVAFHCSIFPFRMGLHGSMWSRLTEKK
jgi:hypothetical protein